MGKKADKKPTKEFLPEERRALAFACLSMGYRRMGGGEGIVYGKPLGFTLVAVDFQKQNVAQWFMDGTGELSVWSSKNLSPYDGDDRPIKMESFLKAIKEYEAYSLHDSMPYSAAFEFSFISTSEQIKIMMAPEEELGCSSV